MCKLGLSPRAIPRKGIYKWDFPCSVYFFMLDNASNSPLIIQYSLVGQTRVRARCGWSCTWLAACRSPSSSGTSLALPSHTKTTASSLPFSPGRLGYIFSAWQLAPSLARRFSRELSPNIIFMEGMEGTTISKYYFYGRYGRHRRKGT